MVHGPVGELDLLWLYPNLFLHGFSVDLCDLPRLPRSRVVVTSSETIKNHKVTATMPNTGPERASKRPEVEAIARIMD